MRTPASVLNPSEPLSSGLMHGSGCSRSSSVWAAPQIAREFPSHWAWSSSAGSTAKTLAFTERSPKRQSSLPLSK